MNTDRTVASDRHHRPAGQGCLSLADLTHGFGIIARLREQRLDEIRWGRVGADRHSVRGSEPAELALSLCACPAFTSVWTSGLGCGWLRRRSLRAIQEVLARSAVALLGSSLAGVSFFSESAGNWRAEPPADEPSVGGTPLKRPRSGASGAQWRGSAGVPAGSDEAGRTHGRPSNSSPADTSLSSGVIAALIASYAVWRGCPINRFSVAGSGSENSLNFSGCWFALIPDNGRKTPSYRDDITSPTQAV